MRKSSRQYFDYTMKVATDNMCKYYVVISYPHAIQLEACEAKEELAGVLKNVLGDQYPCKVFYLIPTTGFGCLGRLYYMNQFLI